jgi:sec-independent protein translocase protein TatC
VSNTEKKLPLVGHLEELRNRLIKSLGALLICFTAAFFVSDYLLSWIKRPLKTDLVFLSPAEAFWANLKVALLGGLFISFPFLLYQAWAFIAPGLFKKEKKYGLFFLFFSVIFFILGLLFCWGIVLPFGLNFLISFGEKAGIQPTLSVGLYIDFVIKFLLAFAVIFQLPLVITLLSMMGVVAPQTLSHHRRYAILFAFIFAAILTPTPDIFNQVLMAGPIIVLFELGILSARLFSRKESKTKV